MEIVLQGDCFNSTSNRWDMKKRNIQEAFLAAEFLVGGRYKPWGSGVSWASLGCLAASKPPTASLGAVPLSQGAPSPWDLDFLLLMNSGTLRCPPGWGGSALPLDSALLCSPGVFKTKI